MHNIRLWKHLERFFSLLFLLAPAAAASEPAPGQQAEFRRARKRLFSTALADPIPGQLLVLKFVSVCKSSVCATPRFFIRQRLYLTASSWFWGILYGSIAFGDGPHCFVDSDFGWHCCVVTEWTYPPKGLEQV
jgi:hypothetical protein